MTELNQKNREIYLDLCKNVWDMDEKSMEYLKHRTSDEWEPVPELKALINNEKATYEDQRIRFDMDMGNETIQSFFSEDDKAYQLFKSTFRNAIAYLNDNYNTSVSYKEFIENKMVFKKNVTKIKKVFEFIYAESNELFENDSGYSYSKEYCADWIVKKFEAIGASKKSAKKLQFVISFNPIDWLLASTSEKFTSCFNLNYESGGGYCYCLGIPFLAGDKNRMMLYITTGAQKEFQGIKVDSVQTRTWCILDKSNSMNIVKWYPNDTVGTSPVVAITGNENFKNRTSFKEGKYALDILSTIKGAVFSPYNDMGAWEAVDGKLLHRGNGKCGQQFFTKNLIDVQNKNHTSFRFNTMFTSNLGFSQPGYNIPTWIKYGLHVDMMFPTARCNCCHEDKAGFGLDSKGGYLCYECYKDQIFTCGSCGGQHYKKEGYETVETTEGKTITICQNCVSEKSRRICSCCGKYSTDSLLDTVEGNRVCNACVEAGSYGRCDSCRKITKNIKINYNTLFKTTTKNCCNCSSSTADAPAVSTFRRPSRIIGRDLINVNVSE